jgi:(S)-ureidoglycine aminohydrolase
MAYPKDLLTTRAVIKKGEYAVIPPEGRVINSIPDFVNCQFSVLAAPKLGAGFVEYIATVAPEGGTTHPFAKQNEIEAFLYVLDGTGVLDVSIDGKTQKLKAGGYAFSPAGKGMVFQNKSKENVRIILYKQRFIAHRDAMPPVYFGDANQLKASIYEEMENVLLKDFFPTDDYRFDFNFHILTFLPTGCHPFVETHLQEHGAYLMEGEGLYLLGADWVQVKKEDFIWFGPFTQQAVYAVGRKPLTYIYSKDCNRDPCI